MDRINGYLCLDNCQKILADKDKLQYWVYVDGVEYYFKPISSSGVLCGELIAYYMAKILGIDVCFCDLAMLDGVCGYISKSLRDDNNKLISGDELLGEYLINEINWIKQMGLSESRVNMITEDCKIVGHAFFCSDYINNLEIIWQSLEYRYGDLPNIKEIMEQFVLMYLFTILLSDTDKHPGNWMIVEDDSGIRLSPLFDNELIFCDYFSEISLAVDFMDFDSDMMSSLIEFFKISSVEYFELFLNMFEKMELNFSLVLNLVEEQIGIDIPSIDREYITMRFNKRCDDIRKTVVDYLKVRDSKKKIMSLNR